MQFIRLLMVLSLTVASHCQATEKDIVTEFSKDAAFSEVKISPDGKFLAVVINVEKKRSLGIVDRAEFKIVNVVRFKDDYEVGEYHWVNDERLVIKMVKPDRWSKEPKYYGELFAVNWNGKKGSIIYGYSAAEWQTGSNIKARQATQGWAEIVDILHEDKRKILISSTPWGSDGNIVPELLSLDVYSGKTRKVAHAPAPHSNFLTNIDGELVLAFSTDSTNKRVVYRYNAKAKDWTEIPKEKFGNRFTPVAVNDAGDGVLVFDNFQQDKTGLFELKLDDFSYRSVFSDSRVDISSYEATKDGNEIFAFKLDDGRPGYALFSDKYSEAKLFKQLLQTFAGDALHITSKTADSAFWVVFSYSDINPGAYYLYDASKKVITRLFERMPDLAGVELASTTPVSFSSFDQRVIHGYYTPAKQAGSNKPLVVNVHGGPHGIRDTWGFDPEVQLLANAGYSVLQINYRGSSGYGEEFLQAGYLQWGDAIQRDIIAGTQWAIASGKAEAGNVCIVGVSFGGYSALQSAILAPDLFNCAVGVAGVYDLNIMKSEGDVPLKSFGIAFLEQVLGSDKTQLDLYSPVNHVAKLKAAVLIAHGKNDERAPIEHAIRLKKAMDDAGKVYQWLEFDDETHGFYSPQNRELYYRQLLAFLQLNLKK